MRPHDGSQTFVFPDETTVLAAVRVLIGSGIGASRLSIHLWGREFAIRTLDDMEKSHTDELLALGARLGREGGRPVNPGSSAPPSERPGTEFQSARAG